MNQTNTDANLCGVFQSALHAEKETIEKMAQERWGREEVNHPAHYGGEDNPYEAIKVIEAWQLQNENLDFNLLTAVKYLARCGLKDDLLKDLKKAMWYLKRRITQLEPRALPDDEEPPCCPVMEDKTADGCDITYFSKKPPENPVRGEFKSNKDGTCTYVPAPFSRELQEKFAETTARLADIADYGKCNPDYTCAEGVKLTGRAGFMSYFRILSEEMYLNARQKGFWKARDAIASIGWDGQLAVDFQALALVMREISEAMEGLRNHNAKDEHCPKYLSVEVELADALIRIMEYSAGRNWDIMGAMFEKMEYNKSRDHMHGKGC